MLKPQDVVLLLKLLANPNHLKWSQAQIAMHLCISVSEINAGIKRLIASGLLQIATPMLIIHPDLNQSLHLKKQSEKLYKLVLVACEEFLISGVKYIFPVQLGEITAGIETSYAAPIMKTHIISNDSIVWPYAEGTRRGMSLEPLYTSVPRSISLFPDQIFYDLLCLIDVLRHGRSRERVLATKMLVERINP
jgi:hypothetical protein